MILCLFVKKVKKGIFCMYYLFILEMYIYYFCFLESESDKKLRCNFKRCK